MFVSRTPLRFTSVIGLTQLGRPTRRLLAAQGAAVCAPLAMAVGGVLVGDPAHPASSPTTKISNVRGTVVA